MPRTNGLLLSRRRSRGRTVDMRTAIRCWAVAVLTIMSGNLVNSFALSYNALVPGRRSFRILQSFSSPSSNFDSSHGREIRRQQEASLEAMAAKGASKIAQMDVSERTKRALLAEAVENRIFQLQQELLELAQNNGKFSQAKKLAQQIKLAQEQYQELVSGDPSDMLRAFESLSSMSTDE